MNAEPFYYAIIRLFTDGRERSTGDVLTELKQTYGEQKLFTSQDVDEALMTAKENGLLNEVSYKIDESGNLVIYYSISGFGKTAVSKYL